MSYEKLKKEGVPLPPSHIEDKVTRSVSNIYKDNLKFLKKELLKVAENFGLTVVKDASPLVNYLTQLEREGVYVKHKIGETTINVKTEYEKATYEKLKRQLTKQFLDAEKHFFKSFLQDADEDTLKTLVGFKLDKNLVFQSRLDGIRELYINNAIERVNGMNNDLKQRFLNKIIDYTEGRTDELDISGLVSEMSKTSVHEARFFARDQFARFTKSVMIASYQAGGAKKVQWLTAGDRRVRDTHKAINNKVFDINNLPPEIDDYNCRCGLVPIYEK